MCDSHECCDEVKTPIILFETHHKRKRNNLELCKKRRFSNIVERKQHRMISAGFKRLISLLPKRKYKLSKTAILKEAADYILELKQLQLFYNLYEIKNPDTTQVVMNNLKLELIHEKAEKKKLEMMLKVLRSCANLPVSECLSIKTTPPSHTIEFDHSLELIE